MLRICPFPAKAVLGAFLALCLFQFFGFGANFAFAESTGVQQITDRVENNEVLRGVKMSPEKARWMEEITAYVKEAGLEGREVILYGKIPALSYYLQMPSAFNPWSDLASYRPEAFAQALGETAREMEPVDNVKRPVVILENRYVQYLTERGAASEERLQEMEEDEKWLLLSEFLDQYGYQLTFSNEKFGVFE